MWGLKESRMKKLLLVATVALLLAASAFAQADLEKVLSLLDKKSETFKQVQTDFEWDQYQKVVDEHDLQKGVMYFKRSGANVDVSAVITEPVAKKLVFKNGEVQIYNFKSGETERHDAGKNRKSFESFLALGFGGRGSDLQKNFEIRYAGTETINGKPTYKLELTPKTQEVKNMFPLITLWINQQTGMSEQQKLDQGEGDYRLAKYFNIAVNPPTLPPSAFDLKKK
jgi:outer membrane lipoprotein-sorting protein